MTEVVDFGCYVDIEQKRYVGENEIYRYKVIGSNIKTNSYVDVPVMMPAVETLHDEIEDVVACVCCGVNEREILRYRLTDVRKVLEVNYERT